MKSICCCKYKISETYNHTIWVTVMMMMIMMIDDHSDAVTPMAFAACQGRRRVVSCRVTSQSGNIYNYLLKSCHVYYDIHIFETKSFIEVECICDEVLLDKWTRETCNAGVANTCRTSVVMMMLVFWVGACMGKEFTRCKKSDFNFNFYILHSCNLRIKIIWFYCF